MHMAATRSTSRGRAADPDTGGWIGLVVVASILAAIGLLAAWWFGWLRGPVDPRVVEIRKLRDEVSEKYQAGGGPSTPAEATAMFDSMDEIQRRIDELPEGLREEARRGGRMQSSFSAPIERYFATPPDQRLAELDRQIDREMMMEKAYESRQKAASGSGESSGSGGTGGGGGTSPGGRRGGTEEDRNRFRKSILDRTTPAQRARYVEHRRAIAERREQRGLPASPWSR
jgi:uncharacterized membrane protein YgcG